MDVTEIIAQAGTDKKGDACVYVDLSVDTGGVQIELISKLERKYGDSIRAAVLETAAEMQVANARIKVMDNGALNFVIQARVETAIARALARKERSK